MNIETPPVNSPTVGPVTSATVIPNMTIFRYDETEVCRTIFGYTSVYRICMAVACFFFVMMLLMFCVFSSRDPRAYIQNGCVLYVTCTCVILLICMYCACTCVPHYSLIVECHLYIFRFWFFKWLIVTGTVIGFFFIPREQLVFSKGILYFNEPNFC